MKRKRDPYLKMLSRAKASARSSSRTKGRHYHRVILTADQIQKQWEKQKGRCYWLGIKLNLEDVFQDKWCIFTPSVDRVNNKWGYFPSNIVIVSRFANLGRVEIPYEVFVPQIRAMRKAIYGDMWPGFLFDNLANGPSVPHGDEVLPPHADQTSAPLPS